MSHSQLIILLIILVAVYLALERKSYPVHPQTPWVPPQKETQPVERIIWATVIHPNGSSTSTGFPVKVRNGEESITIDYKSLGYKHYYD